MGGRSRRLGVDESIRNIAGRHVLGQRKYRRHAGCGHRDSDSAVDSGVRTEGQNHSRNEAGAHQARWRHCLDKA